MDLIYTDSNRVDQGVLGEHLLDLSFGEEENDFEITMSISAPELEAGALIYIENTEYGGIIDGIKATTSADTVTYFGRTWQGILNSYVIEPPSGQDYLIVTGEAHEIFRGLIRDVFQIEKSQQNGFFEIDPYSSGLTVNGYQFNRYCKAYDGFRQMLKAHGYKLTFIWIERAVRIIAKPISKYIDESVDRDNALLNIEKHYKKVNHLICLGSGELANRTVIHLYADQFGQIIDTPYYTGMDEITEIYDDANSEDLRKDGIAFFKELRGVDIADILFDNAETCYDIGDIVGAVEYKTHTTVEAPIIQKIVKIQNGIISVDYKTGGQDG